MIPGGFNRRKDVLPPIPFILTYCDQTSEINNIVKFYYSNIIERTFLIHKAQLVSAIKKNNIKRLTST